MPIKKASERMKSSTVSSSVADLAAQSENENHDCCLSKECAKDLSQVYFHDFGKKIIVTLSGILIVYIIVWFGTLIKLNIQTYEKMENGLYNSSMMCGYKK